MRKDYSEELDQDARIRENLSKTLSQIGNNFSTLIEEIQDNYYHKLAANLKLNGYDAFSVLNSSRDFNSKYTIASNKLQDLLKALSDLQQTVYNLSEDLSSSKSFSRTSGKSSRKSKINRLITKNNRIKRYLTG